MSRKSSKLNQIVNLLKQEFKPSRMFLFGSRASKTAKKSSDYDFVLVVPGNKKSRQTNLIKASDLVWDALGISVDVFVYSQREFDEWKNEFSSIPETAINTGREINLG